MKKFAIILMISCALALTSCSNKDGEISQPTQEAYQKEELAVSNPDFAQPYAALKEIYENIDIKDLFEADEEYISDVLELTQFEDYKECYIVASSGNYGVADVYIIEPEKEMFEVVEKALEKAKENKIKEFKDYSIFNSYEISQEADIYRHGDYMIMLMIENQDEVKDIIRKYIPK